MKRNVVSIIIKKLSEISSTKYKMEPDLEDLKPCAARYNPSTIRNLEPGTIKLWCTCGLSKNQPWCDNSHKDTPFNPLRWTVPSTGQTVYSICNCKYTTRPPYCDGIHMDLPLKMKRQIEACQHAHDSITTKLCIYCGWTSELK